MRCERSTIRFAVGGLGRRGIPVEKCVRWLGSRGVVAVLAVIAVLADSPARADSRGTDFWVAFLSDFKNGAEDPLLLTLSISAEAAASGTVAIPGLSFSQNFTVPAGGLTTVTIPNGAIAGDGGTISVADLGIHVTSDTEVTVYGLNDIHETTDGFLGLPVDVLGTQYRALMYPDPTFAEIGVVSTADGTVVTVVPTAPLIDGTAAGTPVVRTLDQGEVLLVPSTDHADLTGSTITATAPVSVFSGDSCVLLPTNGFACNHLVEQLPPTTSWGTDFITVPLAARMGGDLIRVLADQDDTAVSFNGSVVATLDAGEFYEAVVTAVTHVTSSKPVLVAYFSQGQSQDLALAGDPSMMLVPSTSQFLSSYIFKSTDSTNSSDTWSPHYVNVVVPTADIGDLTVDGTAVDPTDFTAVSGTSFSVAQLELTGGTHRVAGSSPFGAMVYGFALASAYSFPAGLGVSAPPATATLTLAPPSQTRTIGQQACVDATLRDAAGAPQSGALIAFAVTGANTAAGTVTTGTNGVAQFCYSGTNTGTDTVTATNATLRATASVIWSPAGANAPPEVNAGADTSGQEGSAVSVSGTATDADNDPLTTTWSASPGAGVDPGASCVFANPAALSTTVTCNDDGPWTLTLTASDGVNPPVSDSLTLTVSNANPSVNITSPADMASVQPGATVSLAATITDPGAHDTQTCAIDWGDGASSPGVITGGVCRGQHAYAAIGTYVVVVQATDDDGGVGSDSVRVVVAQATAEHHKLFGRGTLLVKEWKWWHLIKKPVTFDFFVSSVGRSLEGRLELKALRDRFESHRVTSLSVRRSSATWSGTGKWNGKPGYTFTATIHDARPSPWWFWRPSQDRIEITIEDDCGKLVFHEWGPLTTGFVEIR